jgi:hypothetical protein
MIENGSERSPWEFEADRIAANTKCSAEDARTVVIARWMHLKGDLRPLADAILKGYEIDRGTLNFLAWMTFDDKELPESLKDDIPYRLEPKRRFGKKGRPKEPANFARNLASAEKYKALVVPGASDKTFEAIANELGTSVSTVRRAKARYSK